VADNAQSTCASWLACDAGNSVYQVHRGDAIAGKLPQKAPALKWGRD